MTADRGALAGALTGVIPGISWVLRMIARLRLVFQRVKNALSGRDNEQGPVPIPPVAETRPTRFVTYPATRSSFEKVGRLVLCLDGLALYSDSDGVLGVLLNGDIDAVLDGVQRDVMLPGGHRKVVGKARLSTSGKALNLSIGAVYYTVPLRHVLAVLDGRNRKAAVFIGK